MPSGGGSRAGGGVFGIAMDWATVARLLKQAREGKKRVLIVKVAITMAVLSPCVQIVGEAVPEGLPCRLDAVKAWYNRPKCKRLGCRDFPIRTVDELIRFGVDPVRRVLASHGAGRVW